jgi:hypothetical protein
MKTKTHYICNSKMSAVFFVLMALGTAASAQSWVNCSNRNNAWLAAERLKVQMAKVEKSVKYTAPGAEYEEVQAAQAQLVLQANRMENKIRDARLQVHQNNTCVPVGSVIFMINFAGSESTAFCSFIVSKRSSR